MAGQQLGVVAAGHPRTARAGADVLRDGGNAVDAALAAMAVSFACEPLLTGLGAGGYMLVVAPDGSQTLLDFFVEAPGRGIDPAAHGELDADRRVVRRRDPGVQHRRGVGRDLRRPRRAVRGRRPLRQRAPGRPRGARRAAGARRRRAEPGAGVRDRDPRGDRHRDPREPRAVCAGGPGAAGRGADPPAGARRRPGAARRGGLGAVLHRRHRRRDRRVAGAARARCSRPRTWPPTRSCSASRSASATAIARC